jgi:hypothetical protein
MINITPGTQYGKLTTIRPSKSGRRGKKWLCSCECGQTADVYSNYLNSGQATNCGCVFRALKAKGRPTKIENYVKSKQFDVRFDTKDVLRDTKVDKHTVSNVLGRLYDKGILERESKPENRNFYNYYRPREITDIFKKAMKSLCISPLNTGL